MHEAKSLKGAIIFYEEGGRLFVGGGTRICLGSLRGGPVFFHWFKGGDQNFFIRSKGGTRIFFAPSAQFPPYFLLKIFRAFGANFSLHLSVSNLLTLYSTSCKLIGTFLILCGGMVVFNFERGGPEFFLFCPRGGPEFFSRS